MAKLRKRPSVMCPAYQFDPSRAFPELKSEIQTTTHTEDQLAAIVVSMAYLISDNKFRGIAGELSIAELLKEMSEPLRCMDVDIDRVIAWAASILLPPDHTLSDAEMSVVPEFSEAKGFKLSDYQRTSAAWSAARMGSVMALGCGVGKSATSTASAITAVKLGKCSDKRCYIISPLNAMGQWEPYKIELLKYFKDVMILSCDSLHKYQYLSGKDGGALIIDEVHKLKNFEAGRTAEAVQLRRRFEWALCLTGTLLHTGPEGIIAIQNIACPGLSRYLSKWTLGAALDCIITKKVGPRCKQRLAIPPKKSRPALVAYLARSVKSLSFNSPEVRAEVILPGQDRTLIAEWPKPDWFKALPDADGYEKLLNKHEDKLDFQDLSEGKLPPLWPADVKWQILMPAVTTALYFESLDKHRAGLIPQAGMPEFSAVMHRVSKLGAIDECLVPHKDGQTGIEGYAFYQPDKHLSAGPKIQWVLKWLEEHPKESIVIGAQAVQTIDMMRAVLVEAGIYHEYIRGGIPVKERTKHIEGFQAGKFRVMLLQQVAGSESVTLTKAAYSILIDHDWSPITYTQFMARTSRRGQERECFHFDLAFGDLQAEIVMRLMRGEAFDAETRAEIEEIVGTLMQ